MLDRDEILHLLQQHYPLLAARYGIRRIGLFGSFAHGQPDESSDIDLIVEFERPIGLRFMELAEELENLLGRKVDLLTPVSLKTIRLPWIAAEIEKSIIYVG